MKTFILMLFFNFTLLFAQDTGIVKYLPLKTGNIWIYNYIGSSSSGSVKLTITGTVINNSHIFYNLSQTGTPCACSFNSYSPFLTQLNSGIRIDSSTGNILWNRPGTCTWNLNESFLDSLKMNPVNLVNTSCYTTSCQDTNNQNIFGTSLKTKLVGLPVPTYYMFRRYAKGIGLVYSVMGCYAGTTCVYTLRGCVIDGIVYGDTSYLTGVNQISTEIPDKFELQQNYPNPFNPTTHFGFRIAEFGLVRLTVFDVLGKEVQLLVNEELQPGSYETEWDASAYPSGVYFYKLESGSFTETKKMVLIK